MVEYHMLHSFDPADLRRLATGYTTDRVYRATKCESPDAVTLSLQLVPLETPYVKMFKQDEEMEPVYARYISRGCSMGAYEGDRLVGIAIGEKQSWNGTLWIWEFHVDPAHRRQGIGRGLMEAMAGLAREHGCRCITLETQNTNLPAISFYRSVGFVIDSIDLSYYTNTDPVDGEVAIFMKRKF